MLNIFTARARKVSCLMACVSYAVKSKYVEMEVRFFMYVTLLLSTEIPAQCHAILYLHIFFPIIFNGNQILNVLCCLQLSFIEIHCTVRVTTRIFFSKWKWTEIFPPFGWKMPNFVVFCTES